MKFKTFQLIIDSQTPCIADLNKIAHMGNISDKNYYNDWYKIEPRMIEGQFLWFYVQHENAQLYGETVLDGAADKEMENTRPPTQVELKHQFFACYDINEKILYLSDYTKKGFMQHYIGNILQKEALIKNIYASLEDFEANIITLERVSFVQAQNLYNMIPGSMFQKQSDLLGFGVPDKLKMQAFYGCNVDHTTKARMHHMKKMHEEGNFEHIVLIGKDDKDVEQSYNFSSILESLEVTIMKDHAGRYHNDDVMQAFILAVRIKNGA